MLLLQNVPLSTAGELLQYSKFIRTCCQHPQENYLSKYTNPQCLRCKHPWGLFSTQSGRLWCVAPEEF